MADLDLQTVNNHYFGHIDEALASVSKQLRIGAKSLSSLTPRYQNFDQISRFFFCIFVLVSNLYGGDGGWL